MPAPLPQRYSLSLTLHATDGALGLDAPGRPTIVAAPPVEWDGRDDVWSPEHLLLAAVASCFTTTFQAVARNSKLAFADYALQASGVLGKADDGATRFLEIRLAPTLSVPEGDVIKATKILESAKRHCFVAASLKTPVLLDAEVAARAAVTERRRWPRHALRDVRDEARRDPS